MRRLLVALPVAVVFGSAAFASAATLGGVTASRLGVGISGVASCDVDGVRLSYAVSDGSVQTVTVTDIAVGCTNGSLRLVLANNSGASIGAGGPAAVTGTTITVSITPQPSSTAVAAAHVSIIGS